MYDVANSGTSCQEVTAPCAAFKPICLEECILYQKKKPSEYLSSGEIGRNNILSLAKET